MTAYELSKLLSRPLGKETLVVLALTSKNSRAPKAEGIPYDKGSR